MSSSTAELTLILKAQNLANAAIGNLKTAVAEVGEKATTAGAQLSAAFAGKGQILARELGNLTTSLLNGQDLTSAGLMLGSTLAGGLVQAFGEKLIALITGSALFATITGALSAAGTAIGGIISLAIPIGMAALPFILLTALVAAIAYLVMHPEVAGEALKIAGTIVGGILNGLAGLAGKIVDLVVAAPGVIADVVGGFVGSLVSWFLSIPGKLVELGADIVKTIVGGLASLPGKVWSIVTEAFQRLNINVGPFHITGQGITIDLPDIGQGAGGAQGRYNDYLQHHGHAAGGWVGLHGPEIGLLGEKGPEYVSSNAELRRGGPGGGRPVEIPIILDGREVGRVIDERLYYALNDAVPTPNRL